MNLITSVQGRRVTPLRAVPFLTDGIIDIVCAASMLADPEAYCDAQNSAIAEAYAVGDYGRLVYLGPDMFVELARQDRAADRDAAKEIKDFILAPPGIVVNVDAVHSLFDLLLQHPKLWENRSPDLTPPVWREALSLDPKIHARIIEGLEPLFDTSRADARAKTFQLIENAFHQLEERATMKGIRLNRTLLPGVKREFVQVIQQLEPALRRLAESTLIDYAKEIGFGWARGARPNSPGNLVEIFFRR